MTFRRTLIVIVIVLGISLLLTAIASTAAPDLLGEPGGLIALFAAIFLAVMGLGSGAVKGWVEALFGKDADQVQVLIGDYPPRKGGAGKDDIKRQILEYLDWVQENFGTIVLRGIERGGEQAVNLPLESVYVPLQAEIESQRRDSEFTKDPEKFRLNPKDVTELSLKNIQLNQVLSFGNRVILTGGPGCGKTTVLLHLAWTLANSLRERSGLAYEKLGLEAGVLPLPIYIPLTRFADYLKKLPAHASAEEKSLKHYISEYLNERSTNLEGVDSDFLAYLLNDGNTVLLLLDGMDEVPTEQERILIRSKIVDLVSGRKDLRVVVTSRTAAYEGQAVFGEDFRHIRVLPLDNDQMGKLIRAAYAAIFPKSDAKARQYADDLLSNIDQLEAERRRRLGENVKPLADAPIMIRMLLIVHYNDRKLPDQRADLYQKAIDVVLRPDNAPDIKVTEEIEKRIAGSLAMNREMLQYLAFHMHARGKDQGREIDEPSLRAILETEKVYSPHVIDELISQTRQRGTLLEERGGLYGFLHLSFQEFLVGRYLAQTFVDADQLARYLEDGLILDSWWREPILLMVGYQDLTAPTRQARPFLLRLAGLDANADTRTPLLFDIQLGACELAATAYLECKSQAPDLGEQLRGRLQQLHSDALRENWSSVVLASAMDALDKLGYSPLDLQTFVPIPVSPNAGYNFSISKYPVTNGQYERFLKADFANKKYWTDFPKYDENSHLMKETCGEEAWDWLQKALKDEAYEAQDGVLLPRYWRDPRFGINRRNAPVVGISWYEASAYCRWLMENWEVLEEGKEGLAKPREIRLPLETESATAAGGEKPENRHAFGVLKDAKEIVQFANTSESGINRTTPVWMYPLGKSPHEVMDMSGNVWEWQANYYDKDHDYPSLRGGSWRHDVDYARVSIRFNNPPEGRYLSIGFRVVVLPSG